MTWTPLATRLANQPATIPHLIAGPILRRVTPTSVSVWLVFRTPTNAILSVYSSATSTGSLFSSSLMPATKVGESLYVTVLTARTTAAMAPGTVYYYDLWCYVTGEPQPLSLADAAGAGKVTFGSAARPSFSLPPSTREGLRLFHASCRKPRSRGSRDVLAAVGDITAGEIDSADGRPHQLFLTGDQIYGDTVPDALLMMISDADLTLIGEEVLPFDDNSSVAVLPPPNTRSSLIKNQAKLTTGATSSHLMTFGEYLLMYVFVWSDVLWPAALPAYADLHADTVPDDEGARDKHAKEFQLDHAALTSFRAMLPAVRRTLANVPTYMIFDDHEVSDDWNLDKKWCQDVYGSALGMRIVTNAMLAYALCQHWGNVPEQFELGAGVELLGLLTAGTIHDAGSRTATLLGLHTKGQLQSHAGATGLFSVYHDAPAAGASEYLGQPVHADTLFYHYQVIGPHHLVAVTDTRTWRSYPRGGEGFPDLIHPDELTRQLPTAATLGARQLFVVLTTNLSPVPISQWGAAYSQSSVFRIKKKYRVKFRIEGEFAESWLPGRQDFFRFLAVLSRNVLSGNGSVIVLSGDVHYAFSTRLQYWAVRQVDESFLNPTPANVVVAQLVASATNNQGGDSDGFNSSGYQYKTSDMRGWLAETFVVPEFHGQAEAFFGWSSGIAADRPAPAEWAFLEGGEEVRVPATTADLPAVRTFIPPPDPDPLWINELPHYRVRMNHLVAAAGSELPAPFNAQSVDPLVARAEQLKFGVFSQIASIDGTEMVGRPNVAEVKLQGDFALHFVLRQAAAGGPRSWVRFDVSLRRQDAFYPMPKVQGEP